MGPRERVETFSSLWFYDGQRKLIPLDTDLILAYASIHHAPDKYANDGFCMLSAPLDELVRELQLLAKDTVAGLPASTLSKSWRCSCAGTGGLYFAFTKQCVRYRLRRRPCCRVQNMRL